MLEYMAETVALVHYIVELRQGNNHKVQRQSWTLSDAVVSDYLAHGVGHCRRR